MVRQVETILSMIGTQTVESLFDKELIRDKFYPESRASHKVAKTISYLHSLASFILSPQQRMTLGFPKDVKKRQTPSLKNVGSGVKVFAKRLKRDFGRNEEDLARLITPEKVQEFARNQVKIIGDLIDKGQNSTSLSQIEYCDLRNFLFIQLLSQNGHRSGVLTNSTLHEYKEMSRVNETNVISVKDHKTYSQHGPANLCSIKASKVGWSFTSNTQGSKL